MPDVDPVWMGAAAVLSSLGTFIAGQRYGKGEFITAVNKAAEVVISRLEKECHRMEAAREKCEEGHAACRQELAAVHDRIDGLMASGVAVYTADDLRRVGKRT